MGSRCVGLALLLCLAGPLDAQTGAGPCGPPRLLGGYFLPEAESYDEGVEVAYTCEKGQKPAAEGWWATILCLDGSWLPQPLCIDEAACLPPEIPNGVWRPVREQGWYRHKQKIRITCDNGFEDRTFDATALCENGTWSSVPVCTKRARACTAPPQIPHAVVMNRVPQEVFPEESEVRYQCRDGYVIDDGPGDQKSITCVDGMWKEAPTCTRSRACTAPPQIPQAAAIDLGDKEVFPENSQVLYQCTDGYVVDGGPGEQMSITCVDGMWTEAPTCTDARCKLEADLFRRYSVKLEGARYLKEGEERVFSCIWDSDPHTSFVQCKAGRVTLSTCCRPYDRQKGYCQ